MLLEPTLAAIAAQAIRRTFGLEEEVDPLLRATSDRRHGDFQLNAAMALSKRLGRKPRELAEEIAEALGAERCVQGTEIAGPGFVNIRLSDAWIAERLAMMLEDAERHGVPRVDLPETIVVDFSSPNIAKQMHVGHLRSTIIGDSIVRMLRFVGHRVIGDNHLGDWGTQFGLLLLGMREWGSEAALEADAIVELERVYKLASTRSEADEAFAEAARAELVKLQAGDAENRALWERFVSTSRAKLEEVYAMLGVEFDEWLGESAYHDRLAGVVQALEERGIAREDQGAICVFFAGLEGAPKELRKTEAPLVIRKRDGAFLYSTTDLATALYRRERFAADRCVYVVDKRQGLHFKQLFAVLGALGVPLELEHVGFGMVLGDDGKPMRTRDASGALITLASLLEESKVRALERIEEGRATGRLRIADESLEEAARVLGIGSVKYADLRQNRLSDYRFEWEKMISFEGDAMPYLNYAYARVLSVFEKGGESLEEAAGPIHLELDKEGILARRLLGYPDVVRRAARTYQPHLISQHLYELAREFSSLYSLKQQWPILEAEPAIRASRLALLALVAQQMRHGLALMGIELIDRM